MINAQKIVELLRFCQLLYGIYKNIEFSSRSIDIGCDPAAMYPLTINSHGPDFMLFQKSLGQYAGLYVFQADISDTTGSFTGIRRVYHHIGHIFESVAPVFSQISQAGFFSLNANLIEIVNGVEQAEVGMYSRRAGMVEFSDICICKARITIDGPKVFYFVFSYI